MIHYCIVRGDLPPGVLAAQLTHAAGESFYAFADFDTSSDVSGTIAVVLEVPDETALIALEATLKRDDVYHVTIREPDAPWNGQLMAIGVMPGSRDFLAPYFEGLPLYPAPPPIYRTPYCESVNAHPGSSCNIACAEW